MIRPSLFALLAAISLPAAASAAPPAIAPVGNQTVYYGKSLVVPVATDGTGPISYTVRSAHPKVIARVKTGNPWLRVAVTYPGDGGSAAAFSGNLTFQLFRDMAPTTSGFIGGFAQAGFYDGLKFHRILSLTGGPEGFIAQGGDPLGNGTGGPGFRFRNEFSPPLIFVGKGQLAMANSGFQGGYSPTNGSQFFVTNGPLRHLDFAHTIFGQLVRGFDVLEKIFAVPTTGGTPTEDVEIQVAELVENHTDAVLFLGVSGPLAAPVAVTLTATNPAGESATATFHVAAAIDTVNSPPIALPPKNVVSPAGSLADLLAPSADLEFDIPFIRDPAFTFNPTGASGNVFSDRIRVTPNSANPVGPVRVGYGIGQRSPVLRASANDYVEGLIGLGDRTLLPFPKQLTANEGDPFDGTVAEFRDFDRSPDPADYLAEVNWGDGSDPESQPLIGVLAGPSPASRVFRVTGQHTYDEPGIYEIVVTVTDDGGAQTEARSRITVTDNDLRATGRSLTAASGRIFNRILASFTDAQPGTRASDYSVAIDWGDGVRSPGRVVKRGASFSIYGTHTYADNQRFPAEIRIEKTASGETATAWSDIESRGLKVPAHLPPYPQAKVTGFLSQLGGSASTPATLRIELLNGGNLPLAEGSIDFFLSSDTLLDASDLPMTTGGIGTLSFSDLPAGDRITADRTGWAAQGNATLSGKRVIMRVHQSDPLGDKMPFSADGVTNPLVTSQ